jgi:membrane peptidoglycan carboxypeptidase
MTSDPSTSDSTPGSTSDSTSMRRTFIAVGTIAATALVAAAGAYVMRDAPDKDHQAGPSDPPVFHYADGETAIDPDDPLISFLGGPGGRLATELEDRYGLTAEAIAGERPGTGGYQVILTIDPELQEQAETAGDRGALAEDPSREQRVFADDNADAALAGYDSSMVSATVSIDPATGAVLAYYGGGADVGRDLAAAPHPPSSTFHLVTAAVAIEHGASFESMWDASSPRSFRTLEGTGIGEDEGVIRNGGQAPGQRDMTLLDAVRESKRTAMYAIAEKWGATAILQTAVDMGLTGVSQTASYDPGDGQTVEDVVHYRFSLDGAYSRHGAAKEPSGEWIVDEAGNIDFEASIGGYDADGEPVRTPIDPSIDNSPFYYHLSLGQYPVSVRDMAAVYATIANDGVHVETHFVARVLDAEGIEVEPLRGLQQVQAIDAGIAGDLQFVASVLHEDADFEYDSFGLPGTWAARDGEGTAHAWFVGAIRQMSTAVWVGNVDDDGAPIRNADGGTENVYGSNTAAPIWTRLTSQAAEGKGWRNEFWAGPQKVGSPITDDIDRT